MIKTRFAVSLIAAVCSLLMTGLATMAQEKKPEIKVLEKAGAEYPDEARRAGVEGKVVVEVTVETNGEVSLARVVTGHRLLNQAAIDAAKLWRFSNTYDGPVTLTLTFEFKDSDTPAPQPQKPEQAKEGDIKVVHKIDAVYPEEAKRKGVEGNVILEITINEKGEVADARVKSGDELLSKAALDAMKQFRFSNSLQKPVLATMTFNFVLGDKDKTAPKKPRG
nr:Gram-negative bacterial tonB protein [uncultured bacterium]